MVGSHGVVASLAVVLLVALAGCSLPIVGSGQSGTPPATITPAPSDAPDSVTGTGVDSTPNQQPSPTASPTEAPTPTVESPTGIRVTEVNADVETVDEEYIVLTNTGNTPLDLSGWRVKDEDGSVYTFSDGISLGNGDSITLHSGRGTQTEANRYWWSDDEVWDDAGETIAVFDDRGQRVYERRYS